MENIDRKKKKKKRDALCNWLNVKEKCKLVVNILTRIDFENYVICPSCDVKLNFFISIPYKGKNLIEFAVNITQRHYPLFTRFNWNG